MSVTTQNHKDAAQAMQEYAAQLGVTYKRTQMLNALAALHGTFWEKLSANPGMTPVSRNKRVEVLLKELDLKRDLKGLLLSVGMAARAIPEGDPKVITMVDTEWTTFQVHRGVVSLISYLDEEEAAILALEQFFTVRNAGEISYLLDQTTEPFERRFGVSTENFQKILTKLEEQREAQGLRQVYWLDLLLFQYALLERPELLTDLPQINEVNFHWIEKNDPQANIVTAISNHVRHDDLLHQFDVTAWFQKASDEEILLAVKAALRRNYGEILFPELNGHDLQPYLERIFWEVPSPDAEVKRLRKFIRWQEKNPTAALYRDDADPLSIQLDPWEASNWVRVHRAHLYPQIKVTRDERGPLNG